MRARGQVLKVVTGMLHHFLCWPTPLVGHKLQEGKPCSGEKLLLMFDRWRKLAKAFYNEKKNQFDISKVCGPFCCPPARTPPSTPAA